MEGQRLIDLITMVLDRRIQRELCPDCGAMLLAREAHSCDAEARASAMLRTNLAIFWGAKSPRARAKSYAVE